MRFPFVLLLALVLSPMTVRAENPPNLKDFQWHQAIRVKAGEALFRFDLPESTYTGSLRPDLGDIRLFNGVGEPLPFALIPLQPPTKADPRTLALPHFPLYLPSRDDSRLALDVRKRDDGSLIALSIEYGSRQPPRLAGYVLDASAVKKPMSAVLLDWQRSGAGTV
ncbi:MAG: DUF3999 family protein, partial [Gallionella sp.]|nr:DUF3999 family protein [Gallionella sp.]